MFEFETTREWVADYCKRQQTPDHQLYSRNLKVKIEGLIIYFLDQHIFKFKVTNGHKEAKETSNSDKLTNLELWEQMLISNPMNRNGQFIEI